MSRRINFEFKKKPLVKRNLAEQNKEKRRFTCKLSSTPFIVDAQAIE